VVAAGCVRRTLVMSHLHVEMEPPLNAPETSLSQAFRHLPPNIANELTALVERLASLHPNTKIDWSDSWSDEDMREFTAASIRRFEAEESEEGH